MSYSQAPLGSSSSGRPSSAPFSLPFSSNPPPHSRPSWSSVGVERYSYTLPSTASHAPLQWIHHPSRDSLVLVLEHGESVLDPSSGLTPSVKLYDRSTALEDLTLVNRQHPILALEGWQSALRPHEAQKPLVIARSPNVAFSYQKPDFQTHNFQIRLRNPLDFQKVVDFVTSADIQVQASLLPGSQEQATLPPKRHDISSALRSTQRPISKHGTSNSTALGSSTPAETTSYEQNFTLPHPQQGVQNNLYQRASHSYGLPSEVTLIDRDWSYPKASWPLLSTYDCHPQPRFAARSVQHGSSDAADNRYYNSNQPLIPVDTGYRQDQRLTLDPSKRKHGNILHDDITASFSSSYPNRHSGVSDFSIYQDAQTRPLSSDNVAPPWSTGSLPAPDCGLPPPRRLPFADLTPNLIPNPSEARRRSRLNTLSPLPRPTVVQEPEEPVPTVIPRKRKPTKGSESSRKKPSKSKFTSIAADDGSELDRERLTHDISTQIATAKPTSAARTSAQKNASTRPAPTKRPSAPKKAPAPKKAHLPKAPEPQSTIASDLPASSHTLDHSPEPQPPPVPMVEAGTQTAEGELPALVDIPSAGEEGQKLEQLLHYSASDGHSGRLQQRDRRLGLLRYMRACLQDREFVRLVEDLKGVLDVVGRG